MIRNYSIGHRYMAYVLLFSLIGQSCDSFSNPLMPLGRAQEQPEQKGDREELAKHDLLGEEDKNPTLQRDHQEDMQELVVVPDLDMPEPIQVSIPITGNQGGISSIPMEAIHSALPNGSGRESEERKKKKREIEPSTVYTLENFRMLPKDVLQQIFLYVGSNEMGKVRKLSKAFYKLTTGYDEPGVVGANNTPASNCLQLPINTHTVDFKKRQAVNPENIPSFPFFQLVGEVINLPQSFWPYLQATKVHTVTLEGNQIGDEGATDLAKELQGSSVHTVGLYDNQIGVSGAAEFAKNLQGTEIHTVDLSRNQIGASGAVEFAKNLQGTSVHTVRLHSNQIGASGAMEFAKNLQGTSVHTVHLQGNQIGASMAGEFAKNLQGTSVQAVYLQGNEIGASGAIEFAKNLQGTLVHTVDLWGNEIGNLGASEFAKNLQGTLVHTVNLRYNEINDSGAIELAKNLQGTNVHTVDIGYNDISYEIQDLLKNQYPNIEWEF